MNKGLLEGFTILDFTQRLPGPFAGHLLAGLGACVIKIEDINHKDAFIRGQLSIDDSCFPTWYQKLNENKKIIRLDFNDEQTIQKISSLLNQADALLLGIPKKIKDLLGLTEHALLDRELAVVELLASKDHNKALHDLNALAETGILSLHVNECDRNRVAPPFVPIAGMAFGQKLALELTAGMLRARVDKKSIFIKCALEDVTKEVFGPIWPAQERHKERKSYLHNGLYPCYNIYQTKDNKYVALAAIEAKYWKNFCDIFKLNLNEEERFHYKTQDVFKKIENIFISYSSEEIKEKANQSECCLSLV